MGFIEAMRGAVKAIDVALDRPTFDREWVPGTYLVSGIFPIAWNPGKSELTWEEVTGLAPGLLDEVRQNKATFWPRGIAGFYAIPIIYQYGVVPQDTIDALYRHNQYYRWAEWFDPILVDLENKKVWTRREIGNKRFVFWRKTLSLAFSGVRAVTMEEIGEAVLTINDGEMNLPVKAPKAGQ